MPPTTRRPGAAVAGGNDRAGQRDHRLNIPAEQMTAWDLPTRPTKATDSRAKNFGTISVELDAIEPGELRDLVETIIQRHLPAEQFRVLKIAEGSERELIAGLVGLIGERRACANP